MAEEKHVPQSGGNESKKVVMNFGGTDIEATIDKDGRIIMPDEVQQLLAARASRNAAGIAGNSKNGGDRHSERR